MNAKSWELLTIERDGAVLTGTAEARYLRVPWPVLLAAAPVLGGAFVFFLPAIAFIMVGYFIAQWCGKLAVRTAGSVVALAVGGWAPGEATLARRWKNGGVPREAAVKDEAAPTEPEDRLADLEQRIADRRRGKRPEA